jgi:hypothetical protein
LSVSRAGLRRATAYLTGQQFIGRGERERRPGAITPPISSAQPPHIGRQAGDTFRHQQRPRNHPTAAPLPRIGQQRGRCGDDHAVDRQPRQRHHPARLPMPHHEQVHMQVDRPGDQRQKRNAANRGPPGSAGPRPRSLPAPDCEFTSEHVLVFGCNPPSDTHHFALTCGFASHALRKISKSAGQRHGGSTPSRSRPISQ